jgi:uncharacterized protein YajQ (UPF0234 family)
VDKDLARLIEKMIKDSNLKLQASIQGTTVRVSGSKKDALQDGMAMVKKSVSDVPLQFNNFRD